MAHPRGLFGRGKSCRGESVRANFRLPLNLGALSLVRGRSKLTCLKETPSVDHRRAASARLVIRALAALSAALPLGLPATASAQEVKDFNAQRFSPAPGPRNFFMTRGARTDGEMAFSGGLLVDFANEPIVVQSCVGSCDPAVGQATELKVVENLLVGDIMGS